MEFAINRRKADDSCRRRLYYVYRQESLFINLGGNDMMKTFCILLFISLTIFFCAPAEARTEYTCKWQTSIEIPFKYTGYITTGDHGVIIEGQQTGLEKGRAVNYALVINRIWTDKLISFDNVYGDTHFKIKLKAPQGTKCKIRIFIYGGGIPKGTINVIPY